MGVTPHLLRSRTTLFASFSGKRRVLLNELNIIKVIYLGFKWFWGTPPNPWVCLADYGWLVIFCEAEQRFLLLFLEKEECS
jgi:hypothetical protein